MGGSLEPTSGTAIVLGASPRQSRRNIGYMRQQAQLIPYRTALQNAALGLEIRASLTAGSRDRVVSLIEEVGLADFQNAFPHELSGGMQQRVALARTLALDSPLVLCDEPFAALDFDTHLEMEEFFWNLIKRNNSACLFVTHDIESAIALGDRVLVLSSRPGRMAREIVLPPDFRTQSPIQSRESSRTPDYFKEIWELLRAKPA
jgi:NitT/TauT family transport system ATP-binding protein